MSAWRETPFYTDRERAALAWAEAVTLVVQTSKTATGQPLQYPDSQPEVTVQVVQVPPAAQSERHMHPVPTIIYVLQGALTVALEGHGETTYQTGQAFVEATNTWHQALNRGTTPVRFLVVYVSGKGITNFMAHP